MCNATSRTHSTFMHLALNIEHRKTVPEALEHYFQASSHHPAPPSLQSQTKSFLYFSDCKMIVHVHVILYTLRFCPNRWKPWTGLTDTFAVAATPFVKGCEALDWGVHHAFSICICCALCTSEKRCARGRSPLGCRCLPRSTWLHTSVFLETGSLQPLLPVLLASLQPMLHREDSLLARSFPLQDHSLRLQDHSLRLVGHSHRLQAHFLHLQACFLRHSSSLLMRVLLRRWEINIPRFTLTATQPTWPLRPSHLLGLLLKQVQFSFALLMNVNSLCKLLKGGKTLLHS